MFYYLDIILKFLKSSVAVPPLFLGPRSCQRGGKALAFTVYSELSQEPETDHFSGFIYNKENYDYLCSSSSNGCINIWDLYNKKISKIINTNNWKLAHIIQWNDKYIIVADVNNKSFKIIDLEKNKVTSDIGGQHTDKVVSIKKIYHPIYGESLLSASQDKTIKLWVI